MNAVDGTDRANKQDDAEPPSLLTIILDTNPHAWNLLQDSLPLSKVVVSLLVFINAHIAINHANRVAVLASHSDRAEWLYPSPTPPQPEHFVSVNGTAVGPDATSNGHDHSDAPSHPSDDANKYRPFAHIEHALTRNLRKLTERTSLDALRASPSTMIAGALTMALTYISKASTLPSTGASGSSQNQFNYSDPSAVAGGNAANRNDPTAAAGGAGSMNLISRILVISVSGDLASQYIPIMNAIFAAQRRSVPLDILKLAGDTVFLQQAADATGGVYMSLTTPAQRAGLMQYLMFAYLPDQSARRHLQPAGEGRDGVDFRAACFCHRRVVDVGYVCSICLSIFCSPLPDDAGCLTCGSELRRGNYGASPAVVPRKKGPGGAAAGAKKKKTLGGSLPRAAATATSSAA